MNNNPTVRLYSYTNMIDMLIKAKIQKIKTKYNL